MYQPLQKALLKVLRKHTALFFALGAVISLFLSAEFENQKVAFTLVNTKSSKMTKQTWSTRTFLTNFHKSDRINTYRAVTE